MQDDEESESVGERMDRTKQEEGCRMSVAGGGLISSRVGRR